ncbi:hypothetical protein GCM10020331_090200 [Ectobacillus funiculus]
MPLSQCRPMRNRGFLSRTPEGKIAQLRQEGLIPFMMVATAGTTDFGSIDCISEMAQLANEEELWLHVDAAYGGALLFSHQYRSLLGELQLADSITIDFHKLYYQSISCGAFFVKKINRISIALPIMQTI